MLGVLWATIGGVIVIGIGGLLGTLRRKLVFDREDGLLRIEQRMLGIRRRAAIPLFHLRAVVVAARRGGIYVAYVERRDRWNDPPRRGAAPCPAARARRGHRRCRRAAARVRRDDAHRGVGLTGAAHKPRLRYRLARAQFTCSRSLALSSPARAKARRKKQEKATEPERKLAGVYPEKFDCGTITKPEEIASLLGATKANQIDSAMSPPRGLPQPCSYEVVMQSTMEYWTYDFDCRDDYKQRADALFAQYKRTSARAGRSSTTWRRMRASSRPTPAS